MTNTHRRRRTLRLIPNGPHWRSPLPPESHRFILDEARAGGIEVDLEDLAARLGVPVVATVAVENVWRPVCPPAPGRRYRALGLLLGDPTLEQEEVDAALHSEAAALRREPEPITDGPSLSSSPASAINGRSGWPKAGSDVRL
ncbi:MAG: hypothetical protein C4294_18730 [Nitrospiraceae bacterium]